MSNFRLDEWCEPSRPDEEFRPGTLLGPTSLLFTGNRAGRPEEASDRWLLELLGEERCVRVLIAEGEEE